MGRDVHAVLYWRVTSKPEASGKVTVVPWALRGWHAVRQASAAQHAPHLPGRPWDQSTTACRRRPPVSTTLPLPAAGEPSRWVPRT
jgi:hypothetical protein